MSVEHDPEREVVYVTPSVASGRPSMTREAALKLLSHPDRKLIPGWVLDEARKVHKEGEQWWLP